MLDVGLIFNKCTPSRSEGGILGDVGTCTSLLLKVGIFCQDLAV